MGAFSLRQRSECPGAKVKGLTGRGLTNEVVRIGSSLCLQRQKRLMPWKRENFRERAVLKLWIARGWGCPVQGAPGGCWESCSLSRLGSLKWCSGNVRVRFSSLQSQNNTHTDTSMPSWIRVEHCGKEPHQEHCQFAQGTS